MKTSTAFDGSLRGRVTAALLLDGVIHVLSMDRSAQLASVDGVGAFSVAVARVSTRVRAYDCVT